MAEIITGLDIGTASVKSIVAEVKKDGSLGVLGVFKEPAAGLRKGILVDFEETVKVLRPLMVEIQKISKKAVQNIFVGFNGEYVKARPSRAIVPVARADQEIQQDDIDRVIQASKAIKLSPNHLVLHNIIREFIVDDIGDIENPLGMTGNRLEVNALIVEAFAPHIHNLTKCLEMIGGDIGGIIFNPLAASQAVLSKRQRDLGSLLLDFGAGTTSLAVYSENKVIHTKSLPLGFSYLTHDIAIGFKIPIETAEKLKITQGWALAKEINRKETIKLEEIDPAIKNEISRRFLAEIIEVRLAEILEMVNNELKQLGSNIRLPAGVFITGGGVKLNGLTELVKQELKLPVQIGFPDLSNFEIIEPSYREMIEDPEMAVTVGLVLWGKSGQSKLNFSRGGLLNSIKNLLKVLTP